MPEQGFVFIEMYTQRTADYSSFFQHVCGFKLIRDEGSFLELRSVAAVILLNGDRDGDLPEGHPFRGKLSGRDQGIGVEVGIIVPNLSDARERACGYAEWTVTELRHQEWGLSDFRVTTPDGYYLRLTEAFK